MSSVSAAFDSTLIRRGIEAMTISDMTRFVASVEQRPLDKLLGDLPGFALFSQTKFNLARVVLRRRLRELDAVERTRLRACAEEIAAAAHRETAERIRELFSE